MGNSCCKKAVPDVEANIKNNRCLNLKKILCCKGANCFDCDNDTCLSSCCVIQNVTNNTFESPECKKRELKKSHTI